MAMEIKKASRNRVKLKIWLFWPSWSGKTYSALLMAYGMTKDWSKICVIDTENWSWSLYTWVEYDTSAGWSKLSTATIWEYDVIDLEPPFSPERYIEAIRAVVKAKQYEVLIIDSVSHEWNGKWWILEASDTMAWWWLNKWKTLTPRHNAFWDAILQSDINVIATWRMKEWYTLITEEWKSWYKVEKVWLEIVQRNGIDYEFTTVFNIDIKHNATTSKDRTWIFTDQFPEKITEETGQRFIDWNKGWKVVAKKEVDLSGIKEKLKKSIEAWKSTKETATERLSKSDKYKVLEKEELKEFISSL